jgi:hypothetical protein
VAKIGLKKCLHARRSERLTSRRAAGSHVQTCIRARQDTDHHRVTTGKGTASLRPATGLPPGYGPPPPAHDPTKITPTDIILPIVLSVFCGIGGFVWGLIRMVQGHHRPGWVAMGINAAVWGLGVVLWIFIFALGMAGAAATTPHP